MYFDFLNSQIRSFELIYSLLSVRRICEAGRVVVGREMDVVWNVMTVVVANLYGTL